MIASQSPDYSYQKPLIKSTFSNLINHQKALLAACPGAGKTRMAIRIIEKFRALYPDAKVMVFAHGQTLLREQWLSVIKHQSSMAVRAIEKSADATFRNNEILVAIPQTLMNVAKLPRVDLLVIDEAHHYVQADETKRIIAAVNPRFELRMTGSPSIYVGKDEWKMSGISVQDLLEHGVLTDPDIELVKADYTYGLNSYFRSTMNLRSGTNLDSKQTVSSLKTVLDKFNDDLARQKTMYICHDQKQALDVASFFRERGTRFILSISGENDGIDEVEEFKHDSKCMVFIVVNRGTLGFDFDRLGAIVDMSGSLNVNKLFQMLCRVVRRHPDPRAPKKRFIKLATPQMAIITHFVMSFVVALSDPEYYYSYQTENTKSARIPVPAELMRPHAGAVNHGIGAERDRQFPDLPALYTFKDIKGIRDGRITTYAMTDFRTVKNLLFGGDRVSHTIESVLSVARTCKDRYDFE